MSTGPAVGEPIALDRRQRRRQETIEEVLDLAVDIMATHGVAGLSVGEVARRMGIRPPSLYVYFPSKHALYDAVFARGARLVLEQVRADTAGIEDDDRGLEAIMLDRARGFVRWSVEHPAYSQLLFWRPVPGFTPSPEAYAPAVALVELSRSRFAAVQERGLIRADARIDDVQRDWTVLTSGVISQQLSNAPGEPFETGAFTSRLPSLVAMFAQHYAAPSSSAPVRRGSRADKRRPDR